MIVKFKKVTMQRLYFYNKNLEIQIDTEVMKFHNLINRLLQGGLLSFYILFIVKFDI